MDPEVKIIFKKKRARKREKVAESYLLIPKLNTKL